MIITYVTSKYDNLKHQKFPVETKKQPDLVISMNTKTKYQKIIGFGGAFTEAACYTLNRLSKANQEKLLKAYFDLEEGLGYTIGRIHMNSSDFALGNYTYVEDNDSELSSFDISRERKYVIPTIKRAESILGK